MTFLKNKHIIFYLSILIFSGCAIKHSAYTLEDIEKHRTLYTQKGIRTSVHYKPLHLFKLYKKSTKTYSNLKNSSHVYEQMLSLPMFPTISKKELNIVTDSINSYR